MRDERILLTNFKGNIYSELTSYQHLNLHGWSSQRYETLWPPLQTWEPINYPSKVISCPPITNFAVWRGHQRHVAHKYCRARDVIGCDKRRVISVPLASINPKFDCFSGVLADQWSMHHYLHILLHFNVDSIKRTLQVSFSINWVIYFYF